MSQYFLGRENELEGLNRLYAQNVFHLAVVYGRRRVGKTALLAEFCRDKDNIFYIALEQGDPSALQDFSRQVLKRFPAAATYLTSFTTWEQAFQYIQDQAADSRLVVAIDEYPYLATANPTLSSILQRVIDTNWQNSKLFVILCGSSMSFMENQILGYQSPLYGRRTAQFKIQPFDYLQSAAFFPDWSWADKLLAYSVVDGIPQYLKLFAQSATLAEAITDNFLRPEGYLFEEPASLLKQELRDPAVYNSIIAAIARGAGRLGEIASKSGEDVKKTSKYLHKLLEIHILRREYPLGERQERHAQYRLSDNMFRFWYHFVPSARTKIAAGAGAQAYAQLVEPGLSHYMGRTFEDIARQYLEECSRRGSLPFEIAEIGRWWGNDPRSQSQCEIDLLATGGSSCLFAECKWTSHPVGLSILWELEAKAMLFPRYQDKYYMLFAKAGFHSELCQHAATRSDVFLIQLPQMFFSKTKNS